MNSWKISTRQGKGIVCGKNTDIIITEFKTRYLVIITDCGKIGSFVHVDYQTSDFQCSENKINGAKVIFGRDEPEIQAVALTLAENYFQKPALFGFSLKEYNQNCVKDLKKLISNIFQENIEQKGLIE